MRLLHLEVDRGTLTHLLEPTGRAEHLKAAVEILRCSTVGLLTVPFEIVACLIESSELFLGCHPYALGTHRRKPNRRQCIPGREYQSPTNKLSDHWQDTRDVGGILPKEPCPEEVTSYCMGT